MRAYRLDVGGVPGIQRQIPVAADEKNAGPLSVKGNRIDARQCLLLPTVIRQPDIDPAGGISREDGSRLSADRIKTWAAVGRKSNRSERQVVVVRVEFFGEVIGLAYSQSELPALSRPAAQIGEPNGSRINAHREVGDRRDQS